MLEGPRPQRLSPFVLVAIGIHASLFALGVSRPRSAASASEEVLSASGSLLNVEIDPPIREAISRLPGSGVSVAAGAQQASDRPAAAREPVKASRADPAPIGAAAAVETARGDDLRPPTDVVAGASPAASSSARAMAALEQASEERRQRGIEAAAAAAARGAGGPGRGGPGGGGAGWSAPAIRGSIAFGNGTEGALTGRVCFLPYGTLRISEVRECQYVATVYTDTLNIPERHFYDGFPGVTNRSEWFLIDYTGTFTVHEYGTYEFRLHSVDGSYLYIDDNLVIENDGKHAPLSRSGSTTLVVGPHRIKVRYAQTNDRMALQLFVRTPQDSEERIFTPRL